MTRLWIIAVVLTIGILLGGCGDDDSSTPDARPTTSTSAADVTDDEPRSAEGEKGGPGSENIGVGERVTVRVLDEDGDVVAGQRSR